MNGILQPVLIVLHFLYSFSKRQGKKKWSGCLRSLHAMMVYSVVSFSSMPGDTIPAVSARTLYAIDSKYPSNFALDLPTAVPT